MVAVVVEGVAAGSVVVLEVDTEGDTIVALLLLHPLKIKLNSQALVGSEGCAVSPSIALSAVVIFKFCPTLKFCATI
jgi:hypothetical protein